MFRKKKVLKFLNSVPYHVGKEMC